MKTLYRKVAVSEEPKHNGNYHCIFPEGQILTIPFLKEYGFHEEFIDCSGITHYLEEIPDTIAQLKADKAELLEALEKVTDLLEVGFPEISAVKESKSLIQKMKKCQENTPR